MAVTDERASVEEWGIRCYGATINISSRMRKLQSARKLIRYFTWLLPMLMFSMAGWVGTASPIFLWAVWIFGGSGVILACFTVYDLFYLEADETKLRALYEDNLKLMLQSQRILRLADADFTAEVRGVLDACQELSNREQQEFKWTAAEDRAGLRAAFFNFQMECPICKKKPRVKDPPPNYDAAAHCENCGEKVK